MLHSLLWKYCEIFENSSEYILILNNEEIDGTIDSIIGQIEFLVLYGRIENLVKYYNFNQNNYDDFIKYKKTSLKVL